MARTATKSQVALSEEFVNLLKSHRLSRCLTLTEMAEQFEVSVEAYRQWEMGKSVPRLNKAKKVALILGVRLSDVIRFIEPTYRAPVQ